MFRQIEVNERAVRNIHIVNSGKFNFDYEWELRERTAGGESMVSIGPEKGGVMFSETTQCQLAFCPPRQTVLRGCELKLKVRAYLGILIVESNITFFFYFNFD